MGNITIPFVGDASQIIKEYEKLLDKQAKTINDLKSMKTASQEAGKEIERSLGKKAQKIIDDLRSPFEKYLAKRGELKEMMNQGLLSRDQFNKASSDAKRYFQSMTDGARQSAAESKQAAESVRLLTDRSKRIFDEIRTPHEKHLQKIRDLREAYKTNIITIEQYRGGLRGLKQNFHGVQEATGGAKEGFLGAFGPGALGMLRSVAGALGLGGGIAGMIGLIREEYMRLIETQKEAAQMALTVAQAEELALTNLGATTVEERDYYLGRVEKIAKNRGMSRRDIHVAASNSLSARGPRSVEETMDRLESATDYSTDPATLQAASGAALDIGEIAGFSGDASLGLLMAMTEKARITDPRLAAVNFAPALTSLMGSGASVAEGTSLFAAMTQGTKDFTGNSSVTASIQFSEQLKDAFPKMGMTEAIKHLQQNKRARAKFLEGLNVEARARTPIEQLVSGGQMSQNYFDFLKGDYSEETLAKSYRTKGAVKKDTPLQRLAATDRALESATEGLAVADPRRATMGVIQNRMTPLLNQVGMDGISQKLAGLSMNLSDDGIGAFVGEIKRTANIERYEASTGHQAPTTTGTHYGPYANMVPLPELSKEERENSRRQAELLEQLTRQLETLIGLTADGNQKSPILDNGDRK